MGDILEEADLCRVCQTEGTPERPLFHPCKCTGSIKFIHEECLSLWLRYRERFDESCELCSYTFSFNSVYSTDMPYQLPIKDFAASIASNIFSVTKFWLKFTFILLTWIIIPCLTANWVYRSLFDGSFYDVMSYTFSDVIHGAIIIIFTTCTSYGFNFLRNQIQEMGGRRRLEIDNRNVQVRPIPRQNPNNEANEAFFQENRIEAERLWALWEHHMDIDEYLINLKHLFWANLVNTLVILVCAFCPYKIGNIVIGALALQDKVSALQCEGLVATLCGYCIFLMHLSIMHILSSILGFSRLKQKIGLCYIIVKVFLMLVFEYGILPWFCGWWFDVCSMPMFGTSFEDRIANINSNPVLVMSCYWLIGVVFVYCFVHFALILQEIVRRDVLWFLREPDFSIQFRKKQGLFQHGRTLIEFTIIFGTAIFFVVRLPIWTLESIWPTLLPCNVTSSNYVVLNYFLSTPLMMVFMKLMYNGDLQQWFKMRITYWCICVSNLLGIQSYLLGDQEQRVYRGRRLRRDRPYTRPTYFAVRLVTLLILAALSVLVINMLIIIMCVGLGHLTMLFRHSNILTYLKPFQSFNFNELDIRALGTFFICLTVKTLFFMGIQVPVGHNRIRLLINCGPKIMASIFLLFAVIPFLIGLLHTLVITLLFKEPLHQTPVLCILHIWSTGVIFYMPTATSITVIYFPQILHQVFRNDVRGFNLKFLLTNVIIPSIETLGLFLAVPYLIAYSLVPKFINSQFVRLLIVRIIYPTVVPMMIILFNKKLMVRLFFKLHEKVKNEKYLVGRQLVNYDHEN